MNDFCAAVCGVSEYFGARPLMWKDWVGLLREGEGNLSLNEIDSLQQLLRRNGRKPSMKELISQMNEEENKRQVMADSSHFGSGELTSASYCQSSRGCSVLDYKAKDAFGPSSSAIYTFSVSRENTIVKVDIIPDISNRLCALFISSCSSGRIVGVCVSGTPATFSLQPDKYQMTSFSLCEIDHAGVSENVELLSTDPVGLTAVYEAALCRLFVQWDWSSSGGLSRNEFGNYYRLTSGRKLSDEEWNIILSHFKTEHSEITLEAFLDLHFVEVIDYADRLNDVWESIFALGYSNSLLPATFEPISRSRILSGLRAICIFGEPFSEGWTKLILPRLCIYALTNTSKNERVVESRMKHGDNCFVIGKKNNRFKIPAECCCVVYCAVRRHLELEWSPNMVIKT